MVQTVQFSDVDVDVSVAVQRHVSIVFETVQFSDVDADVPFVVHDSCSYSERSLTRLLCRTTGVMVQTVQFLDQVRFRQGR